MSRCERISTSVWSSTSSAEKPDWRGPMNSAISLRQETKGRSKAFTSSRPRAMNCANCSGLPALNSIQRFMSTPPNSQAVFMQ